MSVSQDTVIRKVLEKAPKNLRVLGTDSSPFSENTITYGHN